MPEVVSLRMACRGFGRTIALVVFGVSAFAVTARADDLTGAQLYKQMCARCHGAEGEGTPKEYTKAPAGPWPLDRLTRYIKAEMPDDEPGKLTPGEAQKVSAYIFDAFYSPPAQARVKLPRIDLARLT